MDVLWARGASTVREVTEALHSESTPAYTTVLTVLRVLTDKGYVVAQGGDGRAHVFTALVTRAEARQQALNLLLSDFFGGSRQALAQHLVEGALDPEEQARLQALLASSERDD